MKKLTVTVGLLVSILSGRSHAQSTPENTNYSPRTLKIEEVNFVSSYYTQDGNRSAVTGGIGMEKLMDVANSLEIRLSFKDRRKRLHTFTADGTIDYYTSASSDNIDPRTISSASRSDIHRYGTLAWSVRDDAAGTTVGASGYYSKEYDYESRGITLSFAQSSKDNNREVSFKAGAFFDTWYAILPAELRPITYGSGAHNDFAPVDYKPRNSYNAALSVSQVINKRLQMLFTVEPSYQEGLLSTPYHRVYFTDGSERVEKLPGNRMKLPIGMRASYFMGDKTIIRFFYRYYIDSWGMTAHTASLEIPVKITSFVSLSPFYRFNTQTAVRYFAPYAQHAPTKTYYTSDYDISGFDSHFVGAGLRLAPPGGVLGLRHWNAIELRYGHYYRTTTMVSNIITMLVKVK